MKIGIDARLLEETGVGRYIRNLIVHLAEIDTTNEYVVFLRQKSFDAFSLPNTRWKKVQAEVAWHTLQEQWVMPTYFYDAKLDLVHIPYHNPPILYNGAMVVTIHDLTILHFNTGKATTLPIVLYQLKRLGYWLELFVGLRKARHIIAVSQTTKREVIEHFHIAANKITVTYEGVDRAFVSSAAKRLIKDPYYLYVGNAYPHKNLETLIHAMKKEDRLVLVGNDDYFYRRLRDKIHSDSILFFGPANDTQLVNLYRNAKALVFPSLMEGFGLPALEALALGCPIAVSDIPIFHEILGDNASYFDPNNPDDISKVIRSVKKRSIQPEFFNRYSWLKMAKETLETYERSTRV